MWCCTKPYFSFHFSTWATLSIIQREKVHLSAGTFTKNIWVLMQPSTLPSQRGKNVSGNLSRETEIFSRSLFFFPCYLHTGVLLQYLLHSGCSSAHQAAQHCSCKTHLLLPGTFGFATSPSHHSWWRGFAHSAGKVCLPSAFLQHCKWDPGWLLLITHVHWESNSSYC